MPYNPGIQDISGQLLAQGMQARAQGIAGGVTTLFQGLQQNQMMTNQAIARFQAATASNPKLLDFLNKAGTEESPVPVNPDVLKAYADIKSGKTNVQNTALLAQFADSYNQAEMAQQQQMLRQAQMASMASENQLRTAQTLKTLAELQGKPRQLMSLDELQRRYPREQFDYSGIKDVTGQPGVVDITEMKISGRAPAAPVAPVSVGAGGGTLVDPVTGATRIIAAVPQPGAGEMIVYPGATTPQSPAGLPAPAGLPRFLPSGSLLKPQAQAVPTEALEAMKPAPAATPAGQPSIPYVVELPGGEAQRKRLAAEATEKIKQEREEQTAANILVGIDLIKRNLDKTTFGLEPVGMYPGARKLVSQAAVDVSRGIDTVIANIGFAELTKLKAIGGTLGQIAIRELELLQQLRGSLSQDLSKPEFRAAVDRLEKEAENIIARRRLLEGVAAEKRNTLTEDERKQYEALGGTFPKTTTRLKVNVGASPGESTIGEPTPNTSRFTGADRQAYEWLMKNPKDPRADQIRRKLGL